MWAILTHTKLHNEGRLQNMCSENKGNNKIIELRPILQRESQNS
jgi:hypothetical protein